MDPRFGRAVVCSCRAVDQQAQKMDTLLRVSQLGALEHCTFNNFMVKRKKLTATKQKSIEDAYEKVYSYAKDPEGWILLRGTYGCGKTHLAAAIANQQLEMGQPVIFVNTPDLLDHLRAAYSPSANTSYDQRFDQVRNAPLLILDDLGTQSNTEWAQEKLYQIFNYRYNARLPTVITTNDDVESLEMRIRARLSDTTLVQDINILAPDFRRPISEQNQSDLSTLHLHHDQRFESFNLRQRELPRGQAENVRRAFDIAKQFADEPQDWLVFNSIAYGNGKTHLAAAIANQVSDKGESALFIVVPDLLDHLRATFNPATGARLDKRFNEVKTAPLLILDDLGTESATAWAREKLYQLFNYRYNARLATVITTATHIDELDPRLATRMLDGSRCTFFLLEAPSYRGGGTKKRKRK